MQLPIQPALVNALNLHTPWGYRGTLKLQVSCQEGRHHLSLCLPPDSPLPGPHRDLDHPWEHSHPSCPLRSLLVFTHSKTLRQGGLDSSSHLSDPTRFIPCTTWTYPHSNSMPFLSSLTLPWSIDQVPSVTYSTRRMPSCCYPPSSNSQLCWPNLLCPPLHRRGPQQTGYV